MPLFFFRHPERRAGERVGAKDPPFFLARHPEKGGKSVGAKDPAATEWASGRRRHQELSALHLGILRSSHTRARPLLRIPVSNFLFSPVILSEGRESVSV